MSYITPLLIVCLSFQKIITKNLMLSNCIYYRLRTLRSNICAPHRLILIAHGVNNNLCLG